MDINFSALAYELCKYDKIVFYGAGNIAKDLYRWLIKTGMSLDACIVTKKEPNHVYFMDVVPVYQIDEYLVDLKEKNTIILIAVTPKLGKDLEGILRSYGIENYLFPANFSVFHDYQAKTVDQCIEEIVKWNMFANRRDGKRAEEVKEQLTDKIAGRNTVKGRIVIAAGLVSPRVLKIAAALRNEGKEVEIFLYPNALFEEIFKDALQKLGIPCRECACIEEFMYELIMEQAEVIHLFSYIANTVIPYALIKMKEMLSSHIVYDEYDIVNELYCEYDAEALEEERFCLEEADGVCNRGYELGYLSEQCGYHFKGKTVQFIDYCNNDDVTQEPRHTEETLSVCHAGTITTERHQPDFSIACTLEFAQKCAEAKCHYHVYPSIWSEDYLRDYIELERVNKYFHIHRPVPYGQFSKELAKYDYGVIPIRADFSHREINGSYKKERFIYAMANRLFDFLDAGIPMVAATPVLQAKYLESRGVLIPWAIEEYDFEYLRKNKGKYREAVKKAQKELQIKNHIHKLIEFYDSL